MNTKSLDIVSKVKALIGEKDSYNRKALSASILVVGGDAMMLLLRLGGNILITRMLFPEAMGLMAVVTLVLVGLHLFSDAGILNAVVLYSKDRDRDFLDTAWTILIIRGFIVFCVCFLLSSSIADFYENEQLTKLLMVAGVTAIIGGFSSPQVMLYKRDIRMKKIMLLEVIASFCALAITLVWLYFKPTIWALVGHGIILSSVKVFLSYVLLDSYRVRFCYNRESALEIFNLGKWVLISSAATFFAMQGDKAIVAKWMSMSELGVYGVAAGFYLLLDTALGALNGKVLFPVFSEIKKSGKAYFVRQHRKAKVLMLVFSSPILLFFLLFGDLLVEFLYDDRYQAAGWMLQILALGGIFSVLSQSIGPVLISHGDSKGHMVLQLIKVVLLCLCMYLGGSFGGAQGLILGVALSNIFYYPALFFMVRGYGVNNILLDSVYVGALGIIVFVAWGFWGSPFTV